MKSRITILTISVLSFSAQALETKQEFLDSINPELIKERKADGSYNFDNKTNLVVNHDDGTIEYPLLNSGRLIVAPQMTLRSTSSSESDTIASTLNFSLSDDPTPINVGVNNHPSVQDYHPLQSQMVKKNGKEYFRASDSDEIAIYSGGNNMLLQSGDDSPLHLYTQILENGLHAVTTTDIDSDGVEDVINVIQENDSESRTILTTLHRGDNTLNMTTYSDQFSNFAKPSRHWDWNNSYVKAIGGDFNGDKVKDELLVIYNGKIDLYSFFF
ncbi:hypothetical protein F0244_26970, partial [Vibrio mediterranei]|nr:hypothetical protein [Vibrio mediterranei]